MKKNNKSTYKNILLKMRITTIFKKYHEDILFNIFLNKINTAALPFLKRSLYHNPKLPPTKFDKSQVVYKFNN